MRVTPGSAGSRTLEGQRAGAFWGGRLSQCGVGSVPSWTSSSGDPAVSQGPSESPLSLGV